METEIKTTTESLAAARREARRKKILENSNIRLTKITGREHEEPEVIEPQQQEIEVASILYPDPEVERDEFISTPQNEEFPENSDIFELLKTLKQQEHTTGNFVHHQKQAAVVQETKLVKFLKTKIHIALMAISVYLLFALDCASCIGSNVFILLLAWEVVEVFVLKTYEAKSSFLTSILFLLGGVPQHYTEIILKFVQTFNKILKDVAIFLFFFVFVHLFWNVYVLNHELNAVLGYEPIKNEL